MANNCSGNSLPILEIPSCTSIETRSSCLLCICVFLVFVHEPEGDANEQDEPPLSSSIAIIIYLFLHFCVLQVSAWGGYVFIINLIPLHVFVLLLMQRYSKRVYIGEPPLHSNMRTST